MENKQLPADVQEQAGQKWLAYISQFEKLFLFWGNLPEVTALWLAQQIDIFAGQYPPPKPGAMWVKVSDRLPGWNIPVKWRLGNGPATARKIALSEMTDNGMLEISRWEWLDESASPAAGREEDNSVGFAEWRDENYIPVYRSIQYWIPKLPEHSNDVEPYTADQLYELFKQQNEK